jgi:hypothetical protein
MKSINKVLPSDEKTVLILDDRVDVWGNVDNLIHVQPFYFFREEKNKANFVKEKYLLEDNDMSLFSVVLMLKFLHLAFFTYFEKWNGICDIRVFKKEKIRTIFKNLSASYIEDPHIDIMETYEYNVISNFGGMLDTEISKNTNIVITEFIGLNCKHIYLIKAYGENIKNSFPIVNKYWIYFCNIFFCKLRTDEFSEKNPNQNVNYSHRQILQANLDIINDFYSLEKIEEFVKIVKENYEN